MKTPVVILILLSCTTAFPQAKAVDQFDAPLLNWYNLDPVADGVMGASVDRAYRELLAGKTPSKTIIVAIIDSGVDIDHEDLKGQIWVNAGEVPGNQVDDDKNGYVDDVNGWNFIGGKDGRNVYYEALESTRIVSMGKGPLFEKAKSDYDAMVKERKEEKDQIEKFINTYNRAKMIFKERLGVEVSNGEELAKVPKGNDEVESARKFLASRYDRGFKESMLPGIIKANEDFFTYSLNTSFNPRPIVGDNPENMDEIHYGNSDVKGPVGNHGTGIAGVIAALRDNQLGVNGIATAVKIMCIRSTPRGDERDKDVALAIRYAVDNGAHVINLSFGKNFSPQKQFVDDAVRHAESKNVLIIHSSGNEGLDADEIDRFPADRFLDGSEPSNWLVVGSNERANNENVASSFSNYGSRHVDIFAPGGYMVVADTSNTYNIRRGTSLSAPVATGVAALILSYYPDLNPPQIINLLMESSYKIETNTKSPGKGESKTVSFRRLSKSGGIVNAYEALKRAATTK